ncbi:MAG: hypothetical protein JNM43_10420 [Planctomycetaceae bacterium]|nr:hypothetical protein [Planctomycetaceae bacterium]
MTRRLISLAVAVAFTLTLLPIPLPVASTGRTQKDSSQPFPCQNRTCGCCSADQCWKKCCCFTNQQKVSWAEKNKVTLPQFVVDAAKAESARKSDADELARLSGDELETEICSLPNGAHGEVVSAETTADQNHAPTSAPGENSPSKDPQTPAFRWIAGLLGLPPQDRFDDLVTELVTHASRAAKNLHESLLTAKVHDSGSASDIHFLLIIKALECRGQGGQWIVCAPVAMPVSVCVTGQSETPAEFVRDVSERLNGGSLQPPVPPPRIS